MTRRRGVRILIFAGIPIAAIVALILLWNWDWFIPFVDARASAAIGRKVTISHLHVRLGEVTTVVADDVRVANPAGFPADPPFAQAAHLTIKADVIAYIRHRQIVLPEIALDHPDIQALADAAGKNNYTLAFGGGAGSSSQGSSSPGPKIGDLEITGGQAHVVIPKLKANFQLAIDTRQGAPQIHQPFQTTASGASAQKLPVPPIPPDQKTAADAAAAKPAQPAAAALSQTTPSQPAPPAATGTSTAQAGTEQNGQGLPIPPIPPGQPGAPGTIETASNAPPAANATPPAASASAPATNATPPAGTTSTASNATTGTAQTDDQAAQPRSDTAQLVIRAKGTYADQPVTGQFVGGALLSLRDASQPYPVDLSLANGPTHVHLVGTVSDPLQFKGTDLALDFAGPDMSLLYPLTGIPIPKTPAYHITGRLDYADHRFRFENFAGTVGNTDLGGTITEDPGKERPDVTADLHSRRVDLADLGGFIGTQPGRAGEANASPQQRAETAKADASPRLLPQQPLNLPKIRAADIHLRYKGDKIEGRSIPFDTITVALDIVDGRITLHPVSLGVGSGAINGDVDLAPDAKNEIRAKADIKFDRVDVSRLMAATHVFGGAGSIGGDARIDTVGNSVATMLGNGNGGLDLYMSAGGNLSSLLVDLSGFEFGNALLSALGIPVRAPVECFIGQFTLEHGLLATRVLLLDTSSSIVQGSGTVNFTNEAINYRLKTDSKHFTIGTLPAPINITGTFKKPSIMPDLAALGIRGGIAAGLGFLAPPLALLPTIQFGVGDNNRCGRLLGQDASAKEAPAKR